MEGVGIPWVQRNGGAVVYNGGFPLALLYHRQGSYIGSEELLTACAGMARLQPPRYLVVGEGSIVDGLKVVWVDGEGLGVVCYRFLILALRASCQSSHTNKHTHADTQHSR